MTLDRRAKRNFELSSEKNVVENSTNSVNVVMEQNPLETKTKLIFTDVKQKMNKLFATAAICAIIGSVANAQIKVEPYNMLRINAQTQDWWPALRITVPTKSSCAYNLWNTYYGKDVFFVCGEGYLWTMKGGYFGSDISLKKNITSIENALYLIKNLNGVKYQYNEIDCENSPDEYRLGFVAQDVELVVPEVVKTMQDGTKAITYTDLIALLVEGIKEQQGKIDQQQKEIEILQNLAFGQELDLTQLHELRNMVYEMWEIMHICCKNTVPIIRGDTSSQKNNNQNKIQQEPVLYQNTPNPFSSNTEISCNIPTSFNSAFIYIYNLQGVELLSFPIMQTGYTTKTISASLLPVGMYLYTLVVNGVIIDTKRMILTK